MDERIGIDTGTPKVHPALENKSDDNKRTKK
jgi:hypothetical protein